MVKLPFIIVTRKRITELETRILQMEEWSTAVGLQLEEKEKRLRNLEDKLAFYDGKKDLTPEQRIIREWRNGPDKKDKGGATK